MDGAIMMSPWLSDSPVEGSGAFLLSELVVILATE